MMFRLLFCFGITLFLCSGLRAEQHGIALDKENTSRLNNGKILLKYWKVPGTDIGTGKAVGVVDASPDEVFSVIVDVQRYPEFMDRVMAAKKTKTGAARFDFYYEIDM